MFGFPLPLVIGLVLVLAVAAGALIAIMFRRVVPTNMVHIVQSKKQTTSYGRGKDAGNTYYEWPSWLPVIGVTVTKFPESIFEVSLSNYEAYDKTRLPFVVDIVAFFRVEESATAAQRVASFEELKAQLKNVLQGAVRRILGTNDLEAIMEGRSEFGNQFTSEVGAQITEWGVTTVKMIEFMDIRDSKDCVVIENIMAKEKSRIDRESRVVVAENDQAAQLAEIDAQRNVDVQQQDAKQQVGLRTAETDKTVGIAKEVSTQEVQEQAAITAEKMMAVQKIQQEKAAEIAKQVSITEAEAAKETAILDAEAKLQMATKEAEGTKLTGEATAKAQEAILMAPVTAQITLAKEIGENDSYQSYLITLEQVKASQAVGIEMAKALEHADLKIISTGGQAGEISGNVGSLLDMFTTKGGANITGMLAALGQTDEGKALLGRVSGRKAE